MNRASYASDLTEEQGCGAAAGCGAAVPDMQRCGAGHAVATTAGLRRAAVPDMQRCGAGHAVATTDGAVLAVPPVRMPRIPRALLVEEGSTNHCTWRSHGYSFVLDTDEARLQFLALLRKYKDKFGIQIHSYCLMNNHPHLMSRSTLGQKAFSAFWKLVNWGFARWYNRRTKGRGQVVMERLRSPRIQDGGHQLSVMRYGDLNPVRAKVVQSAGHWKWSSHRHYAYGEENDLITDAPEYLALGSNGPQRRKAYLHLFAQKLAAPLLSRRSDLVEAPFVGSDIWVAVRLRTCGLSPPV